jgi:hypothetical protein
MLKKIKSGTEVVRKFCEKKVFEKNLRRWKEKGRGKKGSRGLGTDT